MSPRNSGRKADRDSKGRFKPGNSGKPKGIRNRATQAVERLLEGEAEQLTRKAVEMALEGDSTALRLCLDRLSPPRKVESQPVSVAGLAEASTLTQKAEAILTAIGQGQISPDVGERLLTVVSSYAKALELDDLERRIAVLEQGGESLE